MPAHPLREAVSLAYASPAIEQAAQKMHDKAAVDPMREAALLLAATKILADRQRRSTAGFIRTDLWRLFRIAA